MVLKTVHDLKFPLNEKYVIMVAPSFVVDFSYPEIIIALRRLGFDKVVEVTYGAKMINREYHDRLKKAKSLIIATACPGVVETVKSKLPKQEKRLILIDSPMTAMAKVCKKTYPNHKIAFLSPCHFKKIEAGKCRDIDCVIDFTELFGLFKRYKVKFSLLKGRNDQFDKFYNDYTKVYPLSGGLSKTAQVRKILKKDEHIDIDGIADILKFLENRKKRVKFLDCTFCKGGCIGGPCVNSKAPLFIRKRRVLKYLKKSKREDIPEAKKGLLEKSNGLKFWKRRL